jgi:hypothetical protein
LLLAGAAAATAAAAVAVPVGAKAAAAETAADALDALIRSRTALDACDALIANAKWDSVRVCFVSALVLAPCSTVVHSLCNHLVTLTCERHIFCMIHLFVV